jgi:hypothetical protein
LLEISASSQTAFAVETHLEEGQLLEEQVNMFSVGTRRSTNSRTEGKYVVLLKYLLRTKNQNYDTCTAVSVNLNLAINYHSDIP